MNTRQQQNTLCTDQLRDFFKSNHDKLLCTANKNGEPSIALMGTPRLNSAGNIELELSDNPSVSLNNIQENKAVVFLVYEPAGRARDYKGVRIYAEAIEILTEGEKLEHIRELLRIKFGDEQADGLVATVTFRITKLRPIVDRGQLWNEPPFADA
ncbi:pyridoxamine 5'-phosphate oxidase family protein [Sphingobacterium thalpophilum]|uniref:pyridoxamine 5'-phosphate oxidase family protein n=1 Tax=Sphingobacterium thalpophilum TaxID=259 RepID=UPI0031CF9DB5